MSLALRLLNPALKLVVKRRLEKAGEKDIPDLRRKFERMARWQFLPPPFSLRLPCEIALGLKGMWIAHRPSENPHPGKVILYFHGGGFIAGSPATHSAMLAELARMTRLRICAVDYRLAPEHPFPAAFDDCLAAFDALVALGYGEGDIILGGDSAGGGLALSVLGHLCREGRPPAAAFVLSPLADFTFSGDSFEQNALSDAILPAERGADVASWYLAGADTREPRASPLFGDFPEPPPVMLQFSDSEILRDDSLAMAEKLEAAGGKVLRDQWLGTPHAWALFHNFLPEAHEALEGVARFIKDQLGPDSANR
jgi:monoterpene epsilon-lactone hydrolase